MSKFHRFLACVVLVTFLTGCSGYRAADRPSTDMDAPQPVEVGDLEEGDDIRVVLRDGMVLKGRFTGVDGADMNMIREGDEPRITIIAADDIETITLAEDRPGTKAAAVLIVAMTAGLLGFLFAKATRETE